MSGGVDSSVAALRLRDAGHAVTGLFMRNWDEALSEGRARGECQADRDRRDAVAVCGRLGLRLQVRDFSEAYRASVFAEFLAGYAAGRTPNPDVLCNREIKFGPFLDEARALGAEAIATGHYARIEGEYPHRRLLRAVDTDKDQTYFLHLLDQRQLANVMFPLGGLSKPQVRQCAADAGLPTATKKDSTGLCFIGERDFRSFLAGFLPAGEGEIHASDGRVLGRHPGAIYFTLGQRDGLGLGGVRGAAEGAWYVVARDVARNLLVVDQDPMSPYLLSHTVYTDVAHWIAGAPPAEDFTAFAQLRHRQPPQACRVRVQADGHLAVTFEQPQRAAAPGQSLVLYLDETCLGGAAIHDSDAPRPRALETLA
jgi:tRNA-specific 2-thiouridylase